ncbi:hypothetical protein IWW50_004455, partial [Coemansia erecta]
YHANKINIAIHMVFVPTILWTSLGLSTLAQPHALFEYPTAIAALLAHIPGPPPVANIAMLSMLAYVVFYIALDQIAGLLVTPIVYSFLVTAQQYALATPNAFTCLMATFVVAWVAQFVGHGVFERRAPALLDNLVQAFVMAPFFVFLELLFALGYRPALNRELRNEIGSRVLAFRRGSTRSTR